jgi:hypothetical protein
MRLHIPEILDLVSKAQRHEDKVRLLREHQSLPLEQVLQYNFHPDIEMNLPEGEAPYKKDTGIPLGKSETNLYREGRRLYVFLKGQAPNLKPFKREQLFIELLEGIHWSEADILVAVKDKRLTDLYPGVTYEAARDAFDRLLPAEPPKPIVKAVKLAIPDLEASLARAGIAEKEQGERPLARPASSTKTTVDSASEQPKEKKPMSEARRAGLLKAQAARRASAAAKKAAKEAEQASQAE